MANENETVDPPWGALGLVVVDVEHGRLAALTLLCAPKLWTPPGSLAAPPLVAKRQQALSAAAAKRALAPVAGELWALARQQPGGAPTRKPAMPVGASLPSLAVVQKMKAQDWERARTKAEAFGVAMARSAPSLVGAASMGEERIDSLGPSFDDPELKAFERLAQSAASRWLEGRLERPKGFKP